MGVVHDLAAHVDRGAELDEHPLDGLDGAVNAGAVAARGDEFELVRHGQGYPTRPRIVTGAMVTIEMGAGPAVLLVHGLNGFKEGWGPLPRGPGRRGPPGRGGRPARLRGEPAPGAAGTGRRRPWRARSAPLCAELAPVALVGALAGHPGRDARWRPARPDRVRGDGADRARWVVPRAPGSRRAASPTCSSCRWSGRRWRGPRSAACAARPSAAATPTSAAVADPGGLTRDPELRALLATASDRLLDRRPAHHGRLGRERARLRRAPARGRRLPQPALVVCGRPRPRHLARSARAGSRAPCPPGALLDVPGAGHFPHLERRRSSCPRSSTHLA